MRTLDLKEAASFLKLNPEELRRKVKTGMVPGPKQENGGYLLKMILPPIYARCILHLGKRW